MKIKLTEKESIVLNALLNYGDCIANDYQCSWTDAAEGVVAKKSLGGIISSLIKKEVIEMSDDTRCYFLKPIDELKSIIA
jgi:hypothetical protein